MRNFNKATHFSDVMLATLKASLLLGSAIAAADPFAISAGLNPTQRVAPAMVDTPATLFSDLMTNTTGNAGGNVQTLNNVNLSGGKERIQVAKIGLAAQVNGSIFGICRLPLGSTLLGITVITDTSLGSSTIKFGDAHSGNSALYGAAATLTSTNTPTAFATAATYGVPITTGYDCQDGHATTYDVGGSPGGGGYEDIIMTVGAADLPGTGTLRVIVRYMLD